MPAAAHPTASVAAAVAAELERHASAVFALMGNGNAWFLDAVVRRGAMAVVTVRHEAATVAAADAHHRASGRLAVATTTYGPGYTNAITPLAEAAQARVPLVLVVGDRPTAGPRPWDVDQAAIATAVGAPTIVVSRADPASAARRAVETALVERRPVVLAIPYDIAHLEAQAEAAAEPGDRPAQPFLGIDAEQLALVARQLVEARRPLLLAGRGAHLAGAADALRSLAAAIGARTASSVLASGIFADDHRHLGTAGGFASERSAAAIRAADAVLVVGAGLNQFQMRFGDAFAPDARVVQVDVLEGPTNPRVDEHVRGDARLVAEALVALVDGEAVARHGDDGWAAVGYGDVTGAHRDRAPGEPSAPDGRLDPRSLFHALEALLPADRVIVSDGGHFIGWAPTHLSVADPERLLLVGTAFQTIGLGLASAVGAGVARPDSTIVLVSGDGGALMGLADLDSVVRTVRHGVVVLVNDAAYGAEVHQYAVRGVAEAPMLIDEVDFAAVARGLGAEGAVIETLHDLEHLRAWLERGDDGVFVADCRVSRRVVAPYMLEVVEAATRAAG
ncbi:thiamine pyrophosphate-binding protein [Agrococcus sp. HG114]|uniref:thiamine pyrophosphate-binding protein n=1 Tax=Agrococcus sp. HG114 TaxID=2969757 RepID=UPI00215A81D1|nr:thiamine pyrophosphate-binding protein [Agrococcus sp. HG114]MCR8671731.1 thiamine pyrophosphate-binding protein [Agrococcus sp. HG114]